MIVDYIHDTECPCDRCYSTTTTLEQEAYDLIEDILDNYDGEDSPIEELCTKAIIDPVKTFYKALQGEKVEILWGNHILEINGLLSKYIEDMGLSCPHEVVGIDKEDQLFTTKHNKTLLLCIILKRFAFKYAGREVV